MFTSKLIMYHLQKKKRHKKQTNKQTNVITNVITKAVNELGLEWSPPEEPSRNRLDECFLVGRGQAVHPSCPSSLAGRTYSSAGQAASALHSTAVLQVFQAKMLVNEEVGLDVASLRALRSVTDLALCATKATAQAIERPLSSLAPPLAHDGGDIRSGQSSLPQRSGFSCGGLCGTLHSGSEVVSSDECFLAGRHQTSANARPPSSLKFMTS